MTNQKTEQLGPDELDQMGAIEFNRILLANPSEIAENTFLKLASLEDPELPMLSPMARAAFYSRHTDRRKWIKDFFRATHVVTPGLNKEDRPTTEVAQHEVTKRFGDASYILHFESSASLTWAGDGEYECTKQIPAFSLLEIIDELESLPTLNSESLQVALKKKAVQIDTDRKTNSRPLGYITDDGEFACSITYTLTAVNNVAIKNRPEIWDNGHDIGISSTPSQFSAPEDRWDSFSWVNMLSTDEAQALGLKIESIQTGNAQEKTPSWQLISAEELDVSYQKGKLVTRNHAELNTFFLLFGAGQSWDPTDDLEVEDEENYPCEAPPLISILLEEDEHMQEEEITYLKCLWLAHQDLIRS